jgi:thiamine-monophosphate kinase
LDEFALIRRHFARPASGIVTLGIGDDAALLQPPEDCETVVACDTLVAGRHFAGDADPADIGWKALNVNLSDLAAMGAEADAFLLALTLPEADEDWLAAFAGGLREAADAGGVCLAGGDTTRGPLTITITAIGHLPRNSALRRDGARDGDLLAVTGTLGDAGAALAGHADAELQRRLHRPRARLEAGRVLRGLARAAIDVSDGLLADVGHICRASRVGAAVRADRLPASEALAALAVPEEHRLAWQCGAGDDYELAVAISPQALDAAQAACLDIGVPLSVIGRFVVGERARLFDAEGKEYNGITNGYSHF